MVIWTNAYLKYCQKAGLLLHQHSHNHCFGKMKNFNAFIILRAKRSYLYLSILSGIRLAI